MEQESTAGREGDRMRCQENPRWEECNYPNRNRSWAFIFGKGVQVLYSEQVFPSLLHPPLSYSFSDLKMNHDSFTQFSTPELFQSMIISQSVWKQTLLSISSLAENHNTDNQAFPAPKILSVPPNALMEAVFGCSISSQPAELLGLCGK